ncbi:hypothetical protein IM774_08095 [Erysipelotrichaceae bacterium RD49]|nr:hypothetical protein [Erysipelotrichaceae bacterium RD49]
MSALIQDFRAIKTFLNLKSIRYKAAGDHHYTTDSKETESLVKAGWSFEGIGWYSAENKAVPVYRQYNPHARTGSHNYTTSLAENNHLVSVGWNAEGVAWYGLKR